MGDIPEKQQMQKDRDGLAESGRQNRIREKRERIRKQRKRERAALIFSEVLVVGCLAGIGILSASENLSGSQNAQRGNNTDKAAQADPKGAETDTQQMDMQDQNQEKKDRDDGSHNEDGSQAQDAVPVQITVSAAGDCTLGTDVNFDQSKSFNAYYNEHGAAYFLENVKSVFSADDLTIVNMEGTLTESSDRQDKTFAFKGEPGYTAVLTDGSVEAANLANNHSKDYGADSYTDTIRYMEDAGITTFGYDRTALMEIKGVKIGLTGIYELAEGMGCEDLLIKNIDALEEQGAQIIIVSFHWGTEKENYPDDIQKSLAHSAIDHGADLVLGHHPHVLQGIEKYNGKNIVYSLGNFCFGGNSNPSDKDTMIFQQTFTIQNGVIAEDDVTNIIPCSLSSVSDRNDYQPTPLEGSEKDRVMDKIQKFSRGL